MTSQPLTTVPTPAADLPPVLKAGAGPNGAGSPNGSPTPGPSSRPAARRRRGSRLRTYLFGGLVVALAAAGAAGYALTTSRKGPRPDLLLHTMKFEPLQLTVVERGALESADNREVTCRVKAGTKATALNI